MVTPMANPGILEHGDGTEMWVWLCVVRGIYLGSGGSVRQKK